MEAFYNEIDPLAAQTIREAIRAGVIAPGIVDERDIRDIRPDELAGYTQVHLFAGGGIWSYALRSAGWPDDRPIWTCSCPCQPFSTAGKGAGFDDERHLWPAAEWLIRQCEPECVAGEQVADKGADPWIDLVQADLEALGYAFGCVPLASAGFGAPNIRHRSFWVAHSERSGLEGQSGYGDHGREPGRLYSKQAGYVAARGDVGGLGQSDSYGCSEGLSRSEAAGHGRAADAAGSARRLADSHDAERRADDTRGHERFGQDAGRSEATSDAGERDGALGLADTLRAGRPERRPLAGHGQASGSGSASNRDPGPTNGFWRDADWLLCRDSGGPRWRPVDAGTFPLAPGHSSRVGGLRISGNAINAEVATAFIEAVIDTLPAFRIEEPA